MALPIIPPPGTDEWLGLWLLRIAGRYGLSLRSLLVRLKLQPLKLTTVGWTQAIEWREDQWSHFCTQAHIGIDVARAMQSVALTINKQGQIGFCPICVLDGQASQPIWLRRWMDATTTWCTTHDSPIVACPGVTRLAYRNSSFVSDGLIHLAVTHQPNVPRWIEDLAKAAAAFVRPLQCSRLSAVESDARSGADLLVSLIDHVLVRVLRVIEDYDDATVLARLLGALSAETLGLPVVPRRIINLRVPVISQVRTLHQRIWLLGVAAHMIGLPDKQEFAQANAEETRQALRWWLWSRLDAWDLAELVDIVREATTAKAMIPWPEAQAWKPPSEGAGWFRRVSMSP